MVRHSENVLHAVQVLRCSFLFGDAVAPSRQEVDAPSQPLKIVVKLGAQVDLSVAILNK